jgi:hypothetical protein
MYVYELSNFKELTQASNGCFMNAIVKVDNKRVMTGGCRGRIDMLMIPELTIECVTLLIGSPWIYEIKITSRAWNEFALGTSRGVVFGGLNKAGAFIEN